MKISTKIKKILKIPITLIVTCAICAIMIAIIALLPTQSSKENFFGHLRKGPNKLVNSTSPYLLQHASNPVDWYPWGREAFEKARREDKPILLSIGYSTCYWCHVMEREVFKDFKVANLMNDTVISIKIDREERPDVDAIYMEATKMMTGGGGWPNNVLVTPDLKPFFAGTYFPADKFSELMIKLKKSWKEERGEIERLSNNINEEIAKAKSITSNDLNKLPDVKLVKKLSDHFFNYYDENLGGFYQAPKFPNENILLFLISHYELGNNINSLKMAKNSLRKMAAGGIYDHVGGGFHRYATDAKWQMPHFEKMLYNQALLGLSFSKLYNIGKAEIDKDIAIQTYDYVLEIMTGKEGQFYSALDSESDEIEGSYYSWTEKQIKNILDEDSVKWLNNNYGFADVVKIKGHKANEGKILYFKHKLSRKTSNKNKEVINDLLVERFKRKLPNLDNKVIASWNGLMIDSIANAGMLLKKPQYITAAKNAADFILENLQKNDGRLYRSWRNGRAQTDGFFEDYAFMIKGLVSVYKASGDEKYLNSAKLLIKKSNQLFFDNDNGGYFFTRWADRDLIRVKNSKDTAIASGNSVMLHAFLDLYVLTGEKSWLINSKDLLKVFSLSMKETPRSYTHMIHGLMRYNNIEQEVSKNIIRKKNREKYGKLSIDSKDYIKVSIASNSIVKEAPGIFKLKVNLNIDEGWHINANPASLDFLIPTSIDVRSGVGKVKVKNISYPDKEDINTPLGKIGVYEGSISIPVTISTSNVLSNVRVLISAQACKDTSCLLPSNWVIPINIPVK